jgi:hypothetical protein
VPPPAYKKHRVNRRQSSNKLTRSNFPKKLAPITAKMKLKIRPTIDQPKANTR